MAQDEAVRVIPLTAQTQQVLVQALRQIEFAAVRVIARLSIGNLNELRGRPQLFPQLVRAGVSTARFGRPLAFDGPQRRAQGTVKFELLSPSFRVVRQQR